jgi:hypothetical protein
MENFSNIQYFCARSKLYALEQNQFPRTLPPVELLISNSVTEESRKKFDWRNEKEKKKELTKYDYEEPFKVAQIYIQNGVSEMY